MGQILHECAPACYSTILEATQQENLNRNCKINVIVHLQILCRTAECLMAKKLCHMCDSKNQVFVELLVKSRCYILKHKLDFFAKICKIMAKQHTTLLNYTMYTSL